MAGRENVAYQAGEREFEDREMEQRFTREWRKNLDRGLERGSRKWAVGGGLSAVRGGGGADVFPGRGRRAEAGDFAVPALWGGILLGWTHFGVHQEQTDIFPGSLGPETAASWAQRGELQPSAAV